MNPPARSVHEYQVLEELGRGGMGIVYKARQQSTGQVVALKILRQDPAKSDTMVRQRMKREMRLMRDLDHPNLVRLLDGNMEHDPPYMVFEYLPGCVDLSRVLMKGGIALEHAKRLVVAIAQGLEYLHRQDIIHRDLKPGNVLLDGAGHARIIDFGLSRQTTGSDTVLTRDGQTFGSLQYMAPEQMESASVDQRADIYSFGLIAYELLIGRMVFAGAPSAPISLTDRLRGTFPPLSKEAPDLDPIWSRAVTRCLELEWKDRTPDMSAFLAEIRVTDLTPSVTFVGIPLAGAAAPAPPPPHATTQTLSPPLPVPAPFRRLLLLPAAIVAAAMLYFVTSVTQPPPPSPPPTLPTSDSLHHLLKIATDLSSSPSGTIQHLKASSRPADRGTKLPKLLERWGFDDLAKDPLLAKDPPALSPADSLARTAALLRLDYLDAFCRIHKLPPLLGRSIDEMLPPAFRRGRFPSGEGWTFRSLSDGTNVKEHKPLSVPFEMTDPASLDQVLVVVAGLNLYPEFVVWIRVNESADFSLTSDKVPPFGVGGPHEDADRDELERASRLAPFLEWRARASLDNPPEGVEAAGMLCRGVPPSFFREGSNQLDVRVLEMEGPRHIEGPTIWRVGIGERRKAR